MQPDRIYTIIDKLVHMRNQLKKKPPFMDQAKKKKKKNNENGYKIVSLFLQLS